MRKEREREEGRAERRRRGRERHAFSHQLCILGNLSFLMFCTLKHAMILMKGREERGRNGEREGETCI